MNELAELGIKTAIPLAVTGAVALRTQGRHRADVDSLTPSQVEAGTA